MTNSKFPVIVALAFATAGCSSLGIGGSSGKDIAQNGPTVLNPRTEPGTVQMNTNLEPTSPVEVLADVKDFRSQVKDVKLRFASIPIEVPMENIGGTTWRAELTDKQLQMLAVSGKTITYDAGVVATDEDGRSAQSQSFSVAIKTPDLSAQNTG